MKLSPEQMQRIKEQSKQVAEYMNENNMNFVDSDLTKSDATPLWEHLIDINEYGISPEGMSSILNYIADLVEMRGDKQLDLDPGETADWLRSEAATALREPSNRQLLMLAEKFFPESGYRDEEVAFAKEVLRLWGNK